MRVAIWIIALFIMAGCSDRLVVYHQFLREDDVASVRVKTPDPDPPGAGERLVLFWDLPSEQAHAQDKQLRLWVRYHNGQEIQTDFALNGTSGHCLWPVRGDLYEQTGGIASYRALLLADSQPIDEWRHQVWVDRIRPLDFIKTDVGSPAIR